jgi:predicted phosphodiesterase
LTADYTGREHGIVFDIADGYTHSVPVNGRNYVLTHGHTFRGGDGVLGYVAPITKGAKKVQAQERSKGRSADLVVCGHWHNLHITDTVVCNGALRGYSEYDAGNLFEVGDSRQATWIEEEGVGMTFRYPVEVER